MKRIGSYWILGVLLVLAMLLPGISHSNQRKVLVEADFDDLTAGTIDTSNVSSPTLDELNTDTIGGTWNLYDTNVWTHSIESDGGGQGDKAFLYDYSSGTLDYGARIEFSPGIVVSNIIRNPLWIRFEHISNAGPIGNTATYTFKDSSTDLLKFHWIGDAGQSMSFTDVDNSQSFGDANWFEAATWVSTDANIVNVAIDIYNSGAVTGTWGNITFTGDIDATATINRFEVTTQGACFINDFKITIPDFPTVIMIR